jgi:hypothetical protein
VADATNVTYTPKQALTRRPPPIPLEQEKPMAILTPTAPTTATDLSLTRLHLMRAGYLLMGVG